MKRPIPVTMLGYLFIVVGLVGLAYHLSQRPLDSWVALIFIIEVIAVVGGWFLLKGRNWARWLMLGWLAFSRGGERVRLTLRLFSACCVVSGCCLFPTYAA
jgi:hypothetical protein